MRRFYRSLWVLIFALPFALSGCATTGKSVAMGAAGGAALGAGAGLIADPGPKGKYRTRNVLIGTAIGGVIGAGAGYIADREIKDSKDDAYKKGKEDALKENADKQAQYDGGDSRQPQLIPPKTEARWVPDQIRGQTFIPGHFEYVILQGARWQGAP